MAETITPGRAGRALRISRAVIPLMTDSELTVLLHMLLGTIARLEREATEDDDNEYGHA